MSYISFCLIGYLHLHSSNAHLNSFTILFIPFSFGEFKTFAMLSLPLREFTSLKSISWKML